MNRWLRRHDIDPVALLVWGPILMWLGVCMGFLGSVTWEALQ